MSSLAAIRDSIYKGNSKDSVKNTKMELERGTPWQEILQKAMLPALNQVGDEFSTGKPWKRRTEGACRSSSTPTGTSGPSWMTWWK